VIPSEASVGGHTRLSVAQAIMLRNDLDRAIRHIEERRG